MIRAILFDLDDTLIDMGAAHRAYCADLVARHPAAFASDAVVDTAIMLGSLRRPRSYNTLHYRSWFAEEAVRSYPGLGTAGAVEADYAARIVRFVRPDPAVHDLLASLAGRYALAIVTNGSSRVQRAKLVRAGLVGLVDAVLISGEQRVQKPSPEIFHRAVGRLGFTAPEALMVGDAVFEDVLGARRVGLSTCWVSGGEGWPLMLPGRPDLILHHVLDLPSVLP